MCDWKYTLGRIPKGMLHSLGVLSTKTFNLILNRINNKEKLWVEVDGKNKCLDAEKVCFTQGALCMPYKSARTKANAYFSTPVEVL